VALFSNEAYQARIEKTKLAMAQNDIELLVASDPANIFA
jgi:hypothetical protein